MPFSRRIIALKELGWVRQRIDAERMEEGDLPYLTSLLISMRSRSSHGILYSNGVESSIRDS